VLDLWHGSLSCSEGSGGVGRTRQERYASAAQNARRFRKYQLWGDPDRVLADMTPCMTANAVDPAAARALVDKTFNSPSLPADPSGPVLTHVSPNPPRRLPGRPAAR
jgi:hypothetical protein